jgi:hypothetical protein
MDLKKFKENLNKIKEPFEPLNNVVPEKRYVAFIDILGFGKQIIDNLEETINIYQKILNDLRIVEILDSCVSVQIYSDSMLLTSTKLMPLANVVNAVLMQTLRCGFLVRGGIGYGEHVESSNGPNFYVISQALVNAVEVEKTIKYPCVAFHESVHIPEKYWNAELSTYSRTILHFDGISLISPLNIFWGTSAISIVTRLSERYPEHKQKYDWFLNLCSAIVRGDDMIPNKI